jgi:hypothetical protein
MGLDRSVILPDLANKKLVLSNDYYPLSNFPQRGKVLLLPPWGKVGKGVVN